MSQPAKILGINATKTAVYCMVGSLDGAALTIEAPSRILFTWNASGLSSLYSDLTAVLRTTQARGCNVAAILASSSGTYGSSVPAIKAEGLVELVAVQLGIAAGLVSPQSLRKALGCAKGTTWQARSKEIFNSTGEHAYWSQGMNGASAAAFALLTEG